MMHPQIEHEGIVERYVRNQLAPDERLAFEEHFFTCDDCFGQLQEMERFVAGIRDAAKRGKLGPSSHSAVLTGQSWWIFPALVASSCAALVLAALMLRIYLFEIPQARHQLNQAQTELRAQHDARAALEQQLSQNIQPQANAPLVMLQATRDVSSPAAEVILPVDAQNLVLWIEPGAEHSRVFRVQIVADKGGFAQTVDGLKRNPYGALSLSLPAKSLQPGEYRITLSSQEPAPTVLLGEYRLRIRKP
jgi:Putative zinc-finger